MFARKSSLSTNLIFFVASMGMLGLLLALGTGEVYRYIILDKQKSALRELVQLKALDRLHHLQERTRDLGLALQHQKVFTQAYRDRDKKRLVDLINNQFHQYFVTTGLLDLQKIYVFDTQYRLLAESHEPPLPDELKPLICTDALQQSRQLSGAARIRPISTVCQYKGHPYVSVFLVHGGLKVRGFIQIIIDPSESMIAVGNDLGMPVQIQLPDGTAIKSDNWPRKKYDKDLIMADYTLNTNDGSQALKISVVNDITDLNGDLSKTRYLIMMIATLVSLMVCLVTLVILRKTTLKPIRALTYQLRRVKTDNTEIGNEVDVNGIAEIAELAEDFNAMTTTLKDLYMALESMAFTDSLTDLSNRAHFHEQLQVVLDKNKKESKPFALFMMDLDRFKAVNDNLGHQVGDLLLQQISERLKKAIDTAVGEQNFRERHNYTIARLGGDEFAAILPQITDEEQARSLAKRIVESIEQPFFIFENELSVGISVGISLFRNDADVKTLLQHADTAMYQAKQNQLGFAFYEPGHEEIKLNVIQLAGELRAATKSDEQLKLYFQPMFDMDKKRLRGAEALIYWQHPSRGLIGPDEFVSFAEQTGLIHSLTQWVVKNAVQACKQWHKAGYMINVAINLSVRNLYDQSTVLLFPKILEEEDLDPAFLSVEITESLLLHDSDKIVEVLSELDALGIRLVLDDFGTGYSSLAYLKRLPVREMKIDRSFVVDMAKSNNDAVIVNSTIDLAHNMGLTVTAEGVESEEVWRMLEHKGCDFAQGFYIAKPIRADMFLQWAQEELLPLEEKLSRHKKVLRI